MICFGSIKHAVLSARDDENLLTYIGEFGIQFKYLLTNGKIGRLRVRANKKIDC